MWTGLIEHGKQSKKSSNAEVSADDANTVEMMIRGLQVYQDDKESYYRSIFVEG